MAKSGAYKELTAGYKKTETVNGITCTRKFIDGYPGATDSLPEIGDALDPNDDILKTVVVTQIDTEYYGNDVTQNLYTIQYNNVPGTVDIPGFVDINALPISGGMSGEAISIDGTKSGSLFIWNDDGTKCDQQLFRKIITGSFKITRRLANLEIEKWSEYAGKINNANWTVAGSTFQEKSVLFDGVEYEEYRNSHGQKRYKVIFNFSVKSMPDDAGGYVGWNYLYDEETNKFREVVDSVNHLGLYRTAALSDLFKGSEQQ